MCSPGRNEPEPRSKKKLSRSRIAKALRHQLEHQNVMSNLGNWLSKNLKSFTSKVKESSSKHQDANDEAWSDAYMEDISKNPVIVPLFNLKKYAKDRQARFLS
mmetsp:Transcript_21290/g.24484  ORF Transcript_21290/g.24484 Transcript_21290/m.24484 type:complete len:103 (-) Transcript_21290:218-526(-)